MTPNASFARSPTTTLRHRFHFTRICTHYSHNSKIVLFDSELKKNSPRDGSIRNFFIRSPLITFAEYLVVVSSNPIANVLGPKVGRFEIPLSLCRLTFGRFGRRLFRWCRNFAIPCAEFRQAEYNKRQ